MIVAGLERDVRRGAARPAPGAAQGLDLVPVERVTELWRNHSPGDGDRQALGEVGVKLGAPTLIIGQARQVGTEVLIHARRQGKLAATCSSL